MKNLIRHILKEETNKSVKLISKYYDIDGEGAFYRGENKIQTIVTFFPEDYDDEMTPYAGSSTCNWEFDEEYNLIFKFMTLPHNDVPLLDYIGDTKELEDYLEGIHRKEAEKFILKFYRKRNNPLTEDFDKNKKFLTKLLGEDLIDSIQEITLAKQLPIEFLKSIGVSALQQYIDWYGPLYYFVLDGEPYIYKDRGEYEMFTNNKGRGFIDGEIPERLGLSDMGLRFSDVIDTIFNKEGSI